MKFILLAICCTIGLVSQNVNAFPKRINADDPPTCPPIGDFYTPHEDCSKYYLCNNGQLITGECPGNLFWNQELLACDHQYNIPECVGGTRPPGGGTAAPPTLPPVTSGAPETEAPTTRDPQTEAPTTQEPVTSTTSPPNTTTTSPPNTTTTSPPNTTTTSPPKTTTEAEQETTKNPEPTTRDPNNPCVEDGVYALPVENDCQAYVQCFNGLAIPMTCAEGLQFDAELGKCNKQELVNCTVATTEPSYTTQIVTTQKPFCEEPGAYLVPFDSEYCSTLYVVCADHVPSLQECAEGLLFDPTSLKCERSEDADCNKKPTTTAPVITTTTEPEITTSAPVIECTEPGVYTYGVPGTNCVEYVLCVNYVPIPQTCANGTLYSNAEGKCVRDDEFECPVGGTEPPKSTTEANNGTKTTEPPVVTGAPGTGPTTENLYPCPSEGFHYLQHPETCSKFYMCSSGEFRGVYSCGKDWFHSEIQGCVPPEESDCTLEPLPTSSP